MASIVNVIEPDKLAKLKTKQLLALRDRLLRCDESLAWSDAEPSEIDPATIQFKDDPRWVSLYHAVKAVLSTRERVARPSERRDQRKARMQSGTRRRKGR